MSGAEAIHTTMANGSGGICRPNTGFGMMAATRGRISKAVLSFPLRFLVTGNSSRSRNSSIRKSSSGDKGRGQVMVKLLCRFCGTLPECRATDCTVTPGGSCRLSRVTVSAGDLSGVGRSMIKYSARLSVPTGRARPKEIWGEGLNPCEKWVVIPARRRARNTSCSSSRWPRKLMSPVRE